MQTINAYHGTATAFDRFDQSFARVRNDHFGGGVAYFTDNKSVAIQYAEAMYKMAKHKVSFAAKLVYNIRLKFSKLFDIKMIFTGKELTKLISGTNLELFARNAGLLKLGTDKYDVFEGLKTGNTGLTGEQVFLGLSEHQQKTEKARTILKKNGYDGLKYYGAKIFGSIPHTIYLPYNQSQITIQNIETLK